MAFICKLLGCGGNKDDVSAQHAPIAATPEKERDESHHRFVAEADGGARAGARDEGAALLDADAAAAGLAGPAGDVQVAGGLEKGESSESSSSLPPNDLPSPEAGAKVPKRTSSPALPAAWQFVAMQGPDEDVEAPDAFSAAADEFEEIDDPENDDADDPETGNFAEAWRSFKAQEEVGLTSLREYVTNNYVLLLRKMLSPVRERYATAMLGPEEFDFRGRKLKRCDFAVTNERGLELQCSLWRDRDELNDDDDAGTTAQQDAVSLGQKVIKGKKLLRRGDKKQQPKKRHEQKTKRYCVVYVHDVGGSRLAGLSSLGVALDAGAAGYCAFDTSACGRSDGRHVSFGYYERYDVAAVVAYLVTTGAFTDVVLWGRGAGAVACVLYAAGVDRPLPTAGSYLNDAYDSAYDSVFGANSPLGGGVKNTRERQQHTSTTPGATKKQRLDGDNTAWPYSGRKPIRVDALDGGGRASDVAKKIRLATAFADSLELVPETSLWVVAKPPLVVNSVKGVAAKLGVKKGDVLSGLGTSSRLPHSQAEFVKYLEKLAKRERAELVVHFLRPGFEGGMSAPELEPKRQKRLEPLARPAGMVLDCVVDSPSSLVAALRDHAGQREPVLVSLLDPLLSSALDVLFHSVTKRADFDPASIDLKLAAKRVPVAVPALFGVNDFHDIDRGIPNLSELSKKVFDVYAADKVVSSTDGKPSSPRRAAAEPSKLLVKYNAPLRLALRGTLDSMSSKFLNKSFVFLQQLPGLADHAKEQRQAFAQQHHGLGPPRWVVTTRPWAQSETEQTIDDYESAQIAVDVI